MDAPPPALPEAGTGRYLSALGMKRLDRLVSMALVLAARRRLRAADLAREYGISERTVYRDLRSLTQAGFPIEGNPGDGYRVPSTAYLRPLGLTEAEAVALALAAQMLASRADPALGEHLSSATAKLESTLGPAARQRLRALRSETHVVPRGRRSAGPLGVVLEALTARGVLAIAYEPVSGEPPTRREIEPLGLVLVEDACLVLAWCRLRRDVRAFRVDHIREARRTGERYEPREGASFADAIERERRRRSGS
jgi:predicted DNA-binding transcriptional regulator YafY